MEKDEPLTPVGQLFMSGKMNLIINCLIGLKNPIDVNAIKFEISKVMLKHTRFCSLLVKDSKGRDYWRQTSVNVDDHFIIHHQPLSDDFSSITEEDAMNNYLSDLAVSSPLSFDKPLWEIHLFMAHRSAVFRAHHAIGDGISLMSMFLACCRRLDNPNELPSIGGGAARSSSSSLSANRRWTLWKVVKVVWYTLVFVFELVLRSLWVKDKRTAVRGGAGVELWPRKLATAKFRLDDMKIVKTALTHGVIVSCQISNTFPFFIFL